jgi:hypothetical protein
VRRIAVDETSARRGAPLRNQCTGLRRCRAAADGRRAQFRSARCFAQALREHLGDPTQIQNNILMWILRQPTQVASLVAYIENQEEHHRTMTFEDEFRLFLKRYRIAFDERYVWDCTPVQEAF